ncbi:MAG: hypothetical protein K2L88_05875, partial [Clostridiales bacterium]|nr:hypothetical protein [Clostridiales bacterium]
SAITTALTGSYSEGGTRFEFAHDGELHLHNDVSGLLAALNSGLNNSFNSAAARDSGNYWLGLSGADFEQYFGLATLKYNLDALQTSAYFTADELASKTNAPKGVGKYVVYYSISAPNYVTLGGAQDTSRRNYRFTTVIYREISALTVAAAINGNTYRYNGSNVFATVGYSQYYSTAYRDVDGYLNAGNHTVTLTINDKELTRWQDETGDGVTLDLENGTATIMYNVQKAENKWIYAPSIVRWTWGEYNPELNVISAMASFGTQDIVYSILDANKRAISVEVEADGTSKTVSLSDFDEVNEDIAAALGMLSAGTYFLRGRIDGTGNYTALSDFDYDHEFAVIKVSNTWDVTPNMTNWQYAGFSADGNFIVGEPGYSVDGKAVKYGVFTTEPADSSALNAVGKNIFTDIKSVADYLAGLTVGEYWLAAYYEGTENYKELFHTTSFRVSKATNNSWKDDRMPEISDWTYGGYADRLFTGGEATFGSTLYTVQTVGQDGNYAEAVVGYVRLSYVELAEKLGKLDAGRYNLYVTTNSTDNYAAAKALNIRFAIAKAENVWKGKAPTIEGWVYGSAANTPSASDTVYANGGITKEFYLARMVNNVWIADEAKGVIKDITKADAGMYVYIVTARASVNYSELKVVVPFEIEKRVNAWKTGKEPTLFYNWLSGEADYTFKVPEAEAHSELMRFNLLNMANGAAQNGLDTKTFLTELKKLTSGVFQVRMYIGDDIIYGSESEANKAALAAYAKNYYYLSSTCEIQIAPRVNSFKNEPRISTILYLGDKNIWAKPTAEATLADSEIVFTYKDAVTGELLGNEIPTMPGRYVLTATATASFSEPIERSVEFRVALSPNSWLSAPTIAGWQEDNKPNNPTANAHNGSDKVVFTYANVNTPNVILTEKPTAAGEYIMYAVLEMDGYETLKAEYRFTIAPAFDTQLVTVAIALAVIACLLCGVVLYFAIRRYKEN